MHLISIKNRIPNHLLSNHHLVHFHKSKQNVCLSISMYCIKETSRTLCACVIVAVVVAIFQPCISSTNNVIFNVDTPSIANHYPEHRWWMICCYSSIKRVVFVTTDLIVDRPADLLKSKSRWHHPICCHRCWVRSFQELKSMHSWKKKKKQKKNDEKSRKRLLQTKNV